MKIGLDYRAALVNREGIGRAVRELVRALLELEDPPSLRLYGTSLRRPALSSAELGLHAGGARLHRRRFPARWAARAMELRRRGLDDVLGADLIHHFQLSALPVRRAPEVATLWDLIYLRGGGGFLDPQVAAGMERDARALAARADRLMVTSTHVAGEVERELGVDPSRLHRVPLGGDHVLRVSPDPNGVPAAPFLLTVARVDPRKNHTFALRVFERLAAAHPTLRWVVAGPLGYRGAEIRSACELSPFAGRIDWLGPVPEPRLCALAANCAAFLFPSLDEGFGLPPLEAMTLGAPTIVSDRGSLPEVAGDGARVVDADDEDGWVAATERCLDDPGPARAAARQRAAELTWAAAARALTQVWRATEPA